MYDFFFCGGTFSEQSRNDYLSRVLGELRSCTQTSINFYCLQFFILLAWKSFFFHKMKHERSTRWHVLETLFSPLKLFGLVRPKLPKRNKARQIFVLINLGAHCSQGNKPNWLRKRCIELSPNSIVTRCTQKLTPDRDEIFSRFITEYWASDRHLWKF